MILLLACGGDGPCEAEANEQLRTLCLVQRAAAETAAGRDGSALCPTIADDHWRDECHFRVAEEMGRSGRIAEALEHCDRSDRYAKFCTTHVAWTGDFSTVAESALPDGALRAAWWFGRSFGSGIADPKTATDEHARTAWAFEAIRLTGDLDAALASWRSGTPLRGEPLPPDARHGRYDPAQPVEAAAGLPRVPMYGGASRLQGETVDDDVAIALLEALHFREDTLANAFRPSLSDPRPRVRYTAIQLYRTLPSADAEATLSAMADDPDPIVAALVADALEYRTWEGKPNRPGQRLRPKR